ncbi:hypothetical protein J6590_106926 [Homalodisca vitripennis]|nr:hypothetical protein J6590_106926 [Homalodisca vitripennis]
MAANIVHNNELIRRMLEEDIDNPLLEEDEEVDSDHENVSVHSTDTEGEGHDEEEPSVDQPRVRLQTPTEFYLRKDKRTRWEINEIPPGQAPMRNVIRARIPALSQTAN